jgi:predicted Zn-dependent protease with MMP-like domain
MNDKLRDFFDMRLEQVLDALPERVIRLFDETPLHVEDYPSDEIIREKGLSHRDELCGLFTGVPLTEQQMTADRFEFADPTTITISREGIMKMASDDDGHLSEKELLRQIRITVLHELGHHHGMSEEELDELGYG